MSDHQQPDPLDQLLDSGLKQYSSSEPLAGLEDRILARLELARNEAAHEPARWFTVPRLAWSFAIIALAAGIALGMYLITRPGEDTDYYVEGGEKIDVPGGIAAETAHAPLPLQIPLVNLPKFKPPFVLTIPTAPAQVEVKQEVFPAPAPLSEQERLALAYAQRPPVARPTAPEPGFKDIEVKPVDVTPLKVEALGTEVKATESRSTDARTTESQR